MRSGQIERALSEAQIAVSLAPESVQTQTQLGEVLSQLKRPEEARQAFQRALASAQSVHPEFQLGAVPGLREALAKP
jgi:Flp pilus assembly protein TadD